MIQEIVNFIDHPEEKSPDIFKENLSLKEGIYVFLEKEGDELVIKDENVLKVDKKRNITGNELLLEEFKTYYFLSQMIPEDNKNYLGRRGTFMRIDTPYGISCNKKSYNEKKKNNKIENELRLYFNSAGKYCTLDEGSQKLHLDEFKKFAYEKLDSILNTKFEKEDEKNYFYFFYKTDKYNHFESAQQNYYGERVFNNNNYNLPKTKKGSFPVEETMGVVNSLNGYNEGKLFLRHQTGTFEFNKRISYKKALKLYNFFRLQKGNILPNPFPLFIDKEELTNDAIAFYNKDRKSGHKEIVEHLLDKYKADLQNYYLIYFNNQMSKSRIVDIDFVPVFKHKFDEPIQISTFFNTKENKIFFPVINTVFEFQDIIVQKIFNNSLVQYSKKSGGFSYKYFDEVDNNPKYISANTYIKLMKYRKAFYDFIYKSRHQSITNTIFRDIMQNAVLDDIRHDEFKDNNHTKEYQIKEKLNIWFSLDNYFTQNIKKEENMANKTKKLFDKLLQTSKDEISFIETDDDFAFASGQLIRTILNKSKTGERTHALMEPFLQKTNPEQFKLAIAGAFETYKHEFKFYKGDKRYGFDKIMSDVMGYEPENIRMKEHLPMILAGYFAETIFKKENDTDENEK